MTDAAETSAAPPEPRPAEPSTDLPSEPPAGALAEPSARPDPTRAAHTRGAVVVAAVAAVALVAAFVAWIALTPLPGAPHPEPWLTVQAGGYQVEVPSPPTSNTVAFGAGHVTTSVEGANAFTVIWIPTPGGVDPTVVMSRFLQAIGREPATLTLTKPGLTGPFPSADVAARLPSAYLHGRILVVARRTYLVAEITPGEAVPKDLTRLLTGFDPDPTAS